MEREVIEINDDSSEVCPICDSLICTDLLTKHIEVHFLSDINDVKECKYCQLCNNIVPDVEWTDHITAHEFEEIKEIPNQVALAGSMSCKGDVYKADIVDKKTSDELLAYALHEQEREDMKKERQKEEEEFQRLQSLYGMNSKSSYTKQYNKSIDKDVSRKKLSMVDYFSAKANMMASLMSNEDSMESCTQGVIQNLQKQINNFGAGSSQAVLLSSPTDHFSRTYGDKNWGCGYRNLQMMWSALTKIDIYKTTVSTVCKSVPSVPKIQCLIEEAWKEGYDQEGASQLNFKLSKTTKWIGATEIAVALKYIGLRANIVDFHRPTAADGTHPEMFAWIKRYFNRKENLVSCESVLPLYLQHQGHSRSVVGFEEKLNKNRNQNLLLFDPAVSQRSMQTLLKNQTGKNLNLTMLRKSSKQMKSEKYQIVYIDGIMGDEERTERKVLSSVRIP